MLKFENISKKYGKKEVLHCTNFSFENGIYALLGPNGAGKSTLIKIITQTITPTTGDIIYDNATIFDNKKFFSVLGYLPQSSSFYPNYNAKELLTYLGYLKGLSTSMLNKRIPELLASVNLKDVEKKHLSNFSGGMLQRLGIAQSLLNDPKVLIFDEPTAGLDPKERTRFRNLVASLSKDKIIIIATHIVSDIDTIADEVVLMKNGNIVKNGTIEDLCQEIDGSVFEFEASSEEDFKGLILSQLSYKKGAYLIRSVGANPKIENSKSVTPTLEDVYLYYFGDDYD